jgi:hypothetical protein
VSAIRNKLASVIAKLKNIARENGIDYNTILLLYIRRDFFTAYQVRLLSIIHHSTGYHCAAWWRHVIKALSERERSFG